MSGKTITPLAERALSTAIQRDRERRTGHNGEPSEELLHEGFEVLLVMPVATITPGTSGDCIVNNNGPDSWPIQGIARLQTFPAAQYCLAVDIGAPVYELVPLLTTPSSGSGGGTSGSCGCLNCATSETPLTTDCSSVSPMAQFWSINPVSAGSGAASTGCPGLPTAGLILFTPVGGCTWESQPFSLGTPSTTWAPSTAYVVGQLVQPTTPNSHTYQCSTAGTSGTTQPTWPTGAGATVTDGTVAWTEHTVTAPNGPWVLSIGSPFVTLSLTITSTQQIVYRCPVANWSGLCANAFTLWQPNELPSGCTPPCALCVAPIDSGTTRCLACESIPLTATFTITGVTGCSALNATWELTLSSNAPAGCLWGGPSSAVFCDGGQVEWTFTAVPQPNGLVAFSLAGPGVLYGATLAGSFCQNASATLSLQTNQNFFGNWPNSITITMGPI
jgi:hypothetical protein